MCLKFAKKAKHNPYIKELFQRKNKTHLMKPRKIWTYKVKVANTERYKDSAIPYMQRLLNKHEEETSSKKTHWKAPWYTLL